MIENGLLRDISDEVGEVLHNIEEGQRAGSHYKTGTSVRPLVKTEGIVTAVFIKHETLHSPVECVDKAKRCLTCGVILLLHSPMSCYQTAKAWYWVHTSLELTRPRI